MIRVALAAVAFTLLADHAFGEVGVVTERPTGGRFVEHNGRYLVPHSVTIPGTKTTFRMVPIPGGEVTIGGEVYALDPYWIGRTEVTWGEYRNYMNLCSVFERFDDAGVRQITEANRLDAITAPSKLYDSSFTFDSGEDPNLPAVSMSQYAAKQYTKWLSLVSGGFYRLPSEAEWNHACLAGRSEAAASDENAWHEDNAEWATQIVAQKEPNGWGLYDMLGNACEWTLDAYDTEELVDPDGPGGEPPVRWPTKVFPRLLKGGSAFLPISEASAAVRRPSDDDQWREYDPNTPKSPWWFAYDDAQDVGFRIVRPVAAPSRERRERYWEADVRRIQKVADFRIDDEGKGERGVVDEDLPEAIERYGRLNSRGAAE
ncbi:MAG: SUMF1/EgtB/PvdO family nonheme iron enzyme [Planctomycetota bacterium]